MALAFLPPVTTGRPLWAKRDHPATALFKHYAPHAAGINVWLLDDLTVTTEQPWNDEGVRRVFHGGHINTVDAVEAAALTAAGYSLVDTALPTPTAPLPGFEDVFGTFTDYGEGLYGGGLYGGADSVNAGLPGFEDNAPNPNPANGGYGFTNYGVVAYGDFRDLDVGT